MELKFGSSGVTSSLCKPTLNLTNVVDEKVALKEEESSTGYASGSTVDIDLKEVYFLIMHFLSTGPCKRTCEHLQNELLEHCLLPRRYHAWLSRSGAQSGDVNDDGVSLPLSYAELVDRYPHIGKEHLIKLMKQLILHTASPLHGNVEGEAPNAADVPTLLGFGSFSLLECERNTSDSKVRHIPAYLRWPHMQADQVRGLSLREISGGFKKHHRAPSIRSACYAIAKPSTMVQKMQNIKKLRGHRDAVYCAIFDRSGRYAITGSDDRLVKIWSMETAFCLASCRGHEGDITDLAVSSNNALVASASNDYVIRVWRLPDGMPISVLRGHVGAVTAIAFSPRPSSVYQLLSSSDDGTCRIWDARYSQCSSRIYLPSQLDPAAARNNGPSSNVPGTSNASQNHQILCCAYNANGTVFVTGSSDNNARVWSALKSNTDEPEQPIHELDVLRGHENDVNYVQFSGCAVAPRSSMSDAWKEDNVPKFKNSWFCHDNIVTCSRDGSAIIWTPKSRKSHGKSGRWSKAYHLKVPPPPMPPQPPRGGPRQRFLPTPRGVNMIVWSLDNRFVLAAIMDCRICVWNAADGSLVHCLTGHTASSYVLDVHPFNPRIAMSAGYDGRTIIWDIWEGIPIRIYEIGPFKLVDGKFSQDGTSIVLSDEMGQIYLLNTGQGESQMDAKYDQFFLGDYRPLIRDAAGNVLDQESQLVPHRRNLQDLLCDSSMIPYPEPYQSMYQKRRLGALGVEWRPSSIRFAVGHDFSLGQDYIMPPLADLDRMIEPLPEFIDAMYWEPENEVVSDNTDSEYNVPEECSDEGTRQSLDVSSSSDLGFSSENSEGHLSQRDGRHRLRRRKHNSGVELVNSAGKRVKRRNLDEHDASTSARKRTKNSKRGRKSLKKKSKEKTFRPQRIAARNARSMFCKISETSSSGEDDSDDSSVSGSESDRGLWTVQHDGTREQPVILSPKHEAEPSEFSESQTNDKQRKRIILKISWRDSKKATASVDNREDASNPTDLSHSSCKPSDENFDGSKMVVRSTDLGSTSVSEVVRREDLVTTDASADITADFDLLEESQKDVNRKRDLSSNGSLRDLDVLETVPHGKAGSSPLIDQKPSGNSSTVSCDGTLDIYDKEQSGHGEVKANDSQETNGFGERYSSDKLKENPPMKISKLRIKTKLREPTGGSAEAADSLTDGGSNLISQSPSFVDHHTHSGMQQTGEASSSKFTAVAREDTATAVDSRTTEGDCSEATADAIRRRRSMKMNATSREADATNRNARVTFSNSSMGTIKKQERSSTRLFDQTTFKDWSSSSRVRSRSTRNSSNANQQSYHAKKNSNSALRKLSWMMMSEHEEGIRYIPQQGDEVVYLRQGHQEFLESRHGSEVGPWRSLSEYVHAVEICKVEKLEYATYPGSGDSCCKLTLRFVDPASGVFGKSFKLTLPDLVDFPDFIVEKTWYDAAMTKNWANRDKCLVWWRNADGEGGSWWEGRIIYSQAKSDEFPDSPWERYNVRYKDTGESSLHSPWELYDPEYSWENPRIDGDIREKLLAGFAKLEQSVSRHQDSYGIQRLNEAVQKMDFCNRFPVPLYPELIQLRLENDYYRSFEALKHDVHVMLSNAENYFARNSQVLSKIRRLSGWFEKTFSKLGLQDDA